MPPRHKRLQARRPIALAAALLVMAACGSSSSSTSVTGPTSRCAVTLSEPAGTVAATGGSGQVGVGVNRECTWTARSEASWITLTSGASGQGEGSVAYSVAANPLASLRRGVINVNDQRLEIAQAAAACGFSLSSSSDTFAASGGSRTITVSGQAGCAWTATSQAPWITIASGNSGSGDGSVTLQVAANASQTSRGGAVIIGGVTYTATQAAAAGTAPPPTDSSCSLVVAPLSIEVSAEATVRSISLAASRPACTWTASSTAAWMTVLSAASGSGSTQVEVQIGVNTNTALRVGTLAIGNSIVTVVQAAATPPTPGQPPPPTPVTCTFSLSPGSQAIAAAGGEQEVGVTASDASCAWTATSAAPWISLLAGSSGTGNGVVRYSVGANTATSERSGTLIVAEQTVTVVQAAAPTPPAPGCTFTISPEVQGFPSQGGERDIQLGASAQTCSWSSSVGAAWLTIIEGANGTGNGRVRYRASANTDTSERRSSVTVGGRTVTIVQEAAPPACTFSVAPTTHQGVANSGGTRDVRVTASAGTCSWTASSGAPWISITSGASGTGSGDVRFTAGANAATTQRAGTLTVAGQIVTVFQDPTAAPPCTFSVAPTSQTVPSASGTRDARVTASAGTCSWTAASNAPWISVTSGATGTGTADVQYSIAENTTTSQRTGTLTIAGATVNVVQEATPPPPPCTFSIAPTSHTVPSAGGTRESRLTASAGSCAWTASSDVPWISLASGASGTGGTDVRFTVAPNTTTTQRTGRVTVSGQSVTVVQDAAPPPPPCTFSVAPTSQAVPQAGGPFAVTVTPSAGTCTWTASTATPSISIVSGATGTGTGEVRYTVTANTTSTPRTGTLTIAGQTVTVTQAAAPPPCTFTVAPTTQAVGALGGAQMVRVTASAATCTWTASTTTPWLSIVSGPSGTGTADVRYTVLPNTAAAPRTGTLSVAGQTVTVTQAGVAPGIELSEALASSSATPPNPFAGLR